MTDWDIGDEDIWRLAVLILELPKENSSQPGSKDSRYWLGLLRPVLIVEDDVGSSCPDDKLPRLAACYCESGCQPARILKLGWNMDELSAIVGFIAGLVTTAANLPQVWKTYRSKSALGLSFRMLLALAIGLGLWITYGIMIKSLPLIATNVIVFLLILSLIAMKLRFDRAPTKD
jgi:MtN3 and saliva related transmembrane protein